MFERRRGPRQPVWVDLACVLDDARSPPTRFNPAGYDLSAHVPGLLVLWVPTAHGRTAALVECTLRRAADAGGGLPVTLLVPARAVSPRRDQPARSGASL
jgi:hypothetical protein